MAANDRDTRRVQKLLAQGRPNMALLIALRPSLFQTIVITILIIGVFL